MSNYVFAIDYLGEKALFCLFGAVDVIHREHFTWGYIPMWLVTEPHTNTNQHSLRGHWYCKAMYTYMCNQSLMSWISIGFHYGICSVTLCFILCSSDQCVNLSTLLETDMGILLLTWINFNPSMD